MYRKYFQLSEQIAKTFFFSKESKLLDVSCGNLLPQRWAGHSKWQNIKSTKEAADKSRSAAFQKIINKIRTAIKQGGKDAVGNVKLKILIEEAKKANMPKATLEKALKSENLQGDKSYWTVFTNPKGIVVGVEVNFANNKPSFLSTKLMPHFKKVNLKMEPHFSHLCDERGLVFTNALENVKDPFEKALEDGIEIGVEEVHENEDKSLIFECLPDRIDSISQQLSKKGYNIQSASVELDFKNFVNLEEEEIIELEKVIAKLQNEFEEVLRVSYNAIQP